ncbi:MAG: hypothetical protein Q9187_003751 [Circinaria calcarea]
MEDERKQASAGGKPVAISSVTREHLSRFNVHGEFHGDTNMADPNNSVPNIVVRETNGQESSISLSEVTLVSASSRSLDESSSNGEATPNLTGLQLQPGDGPGHQTLLAEGPIIPETVSYTLHITFEGKPLQQVIEGTVLVNDGSGYRQIERIAGQQLRDRHPDSLASRELNFRHGSCKIVSDGSYETIHTLTSQEDWRKVCIALINSWTTQSHQSLRLVISRDYFTLQTHALGKDSFSSTKRYEIDGLMKPSTSLKFYIPRIDLIRVTSADSIRQIILEDESLNLGDNEKESFIKGVQQRAGKLLAMCVLARLGMDCLRTLMDAGLTDGSLPLKERDRCHQKCSADFRNLLEKQGGFMAPVFNNIGEHKALHSCVVVPLRFYPREQVTGANPEDETGSSNGSAPPLINEDDAEKRKAYCGHGAFSEVYRVRMDPDHHKLSQDPDADFALKEFKYRPLRAGSDFKQEMRILNELRKYRHDRIVTHLASWTQGKQDYMLFPYAQCNLREYMKQTCFDAQNKERLLWFLEQLLGLAHALHHLHNFVDTRSATSPSTLVAPSPEVRKSGWHHDIKPENILHYRDVAAKYGSFCIADFGSGKVHTYRSGSVNTRSPNGTLTYEPPEAKCEGATSRPYDVWSLGCVFLELVIWAVFNNEAVEGFAAERVARRYPESRTDAFEDDAFWQMTEDNRPFLRDAVNHRIEELKSEVSNGEAQHFKEVVELIEKMLDPYRRTRIIALDLWDTLTRIVEQKRVDLNNAQDDSLRESSSTRGVRLPRLSLQTPVRRDPELAIPGSPYEEARLSPVAYPSSSSALPILSRQQAPANGQPTITVRSPRSGQHSRKSSASENRLSPGPI